MTDRYLSKKRSIPTCRRASASVSLDSEAGTGGSSTPGSSKALKVPANSLKRSDSFRMDLAFNSIDEMDRERLELITRQFLLSILAIVTTQVCYASFVVALGIETSRGTGEFDQRAYAVVYGGFFYPMEVVLNGLALYFEFHLVQKPQHYEFCCKVCHVWCSRYVVRRASRQILNEHADEIGTIDVQNSG